MRVYLIGRGYQTTEIDVTDAAGRLVSWLADAANPLLTEVIQTWLWLPPDAGGLGALAESDRDVELLREELIAQCRRPHGDSGNRGAR